MFKKVYKAARRNKNGVDTESGYYKLFRGSILSSALKHFFFFIVYTLPEGPTFAITELQASKGCWRGSSQGDDAVKYDLDAGLQ